MANSSTDRQVTYPDPRSLAFPLGAVPNAIGLTKRELFAAMAMQGILAQDDCSSPKYIAEEALKCADALLAELAKVTS